MCFEERLSRSFPDSVSKSHLSVLSVPLSEVDLVLRPVPERARTFVSSQFQITFYYKMLFF